MAYLDMTMQVHYHFASSLCLLFKMKNYTAKPQSVCFDDLLIQFATPFHIQFPLTHFFEQKAYIS